MCSDYWKYSLVLADGSVLVEHPGGLTKDNYLFTMGYLLCCPVYKEEYYMYFTLGTWQVKFISSANDFDMNDFNEMCMSAMHM